MKGYFIDYISINVGKNGPFINKSSFLNEIYIEKEVLIENLYSAMVQCFLVELGPISGLHVVPFLFSKQTNKVMKFLWVIYRPG